jgi:hypothetical protein
MEIEFPISSIEENLEEDLIIYKKLENPFVLKILPYGRAFNQIITTKSDKKESNDENENKITIKLSEKKEYSKMNNVNDPYEILGLGNIKIKFRKLQT